MDRGARKRELKGKKRNGNAHFVVPATSGRNAVGVVRHFSDEHRVSLVGDKVLQALQIRLQYLPQMFRLLLLSVQLEVSDAFHVVEERVPVLRQFVLLLRRFGRVARGQELHGLVDDLLRDEPRDEHDLYAPRFLHEAGKRYLSVLAFLGAPWVLVRIEFDGDGVLRAEEERLRFSFQFGFTFF